MNTRGSSAYFGMLSIGDHSFADLSIVSFSLGIGKVVISRLQQESSM